MSWNTPDAQLEALMKTGDIGCDLQVSVAILDLDPAHKAVNITLGKIRLMLGLHADAMKAAENTIESTPGNADVLMLMVNIMRRGQRREALSLNSSSSRTS